MKNLNTNNLKYLVVNAEDEQWGIYVTTIGFQQVKRNSIYPPVGHPPAYWFDPDKGRILQEFQLIYIVKGFGTFKSTSCKETAIAEGNIVLLFPQEWHTYKPVRNIDWEAYWIGFNGENMQKLLHNELFSKYNPVLDIGFNEQITTVFNQGIEIAKLQRTAHQPMLAGITNLLLSFVYYCDRNNSFRDKEVVSKINQAKTMMRNEIYYNQSPAQIAEELNISYSWFRKVFREYTGFSPVQYQMEIKAQKAKELLTSSSMQIKEIAFELNFESVSYFITFFKSKAGVSPEEYRKRIHTGENYFKD